MKKLIFLCFVLMGCKAELREPFCKNSLAVVPPEMQGFYEVTMPMNSLELSGNSVLKSALLKIDETTLQSSQQLGMVGEVTGFCEIQGRYYLEQLNYNGTYTMTELTKFAHGLMMSQMAIDIEKAMAMNLKLHYVPNVDKPDVNGGTVESLLGTGSFILDNTKMTTEEVLKVAKPLSVLMVLRSVGTKVGFKPVQTFRVKRE